jgi:hypothetical protein
MFNAPKWKNLSYSYGLMRNREKAEALFSVFQPPQTIGNGG